MAAPAPTETPLPVPDPGQAIAGYVRPTPRDPSGRWLELAAPEGHWAVLYDTTLCTAPIPWTNVWLARDNQNNRPITVNRDDGGMCVVAQWSWSSDVPCAADDQGTCDVDMDGAYWETVAQAEPTATEPPVTVPASPPTPQPPPPTPGPQPPGIVNVRQPSAPASRAPQVVYVEVTQPPQFESAAERPTVSLAPTSIPVPTAAATPTVAPYDMPTAMPSVTVAVLADIGTPSATVIPEAAATVASVAATSPTPSLAVDRTPYLVVAMVAVILGAFAVLIGRKAGRLT